VIATIFQWLAVLVVGGASGAVMAVLILRLRFRRADRMAEYEIDDSDIDSVAKAWAEGTGRPWAVRSVADKLRLLSRLERRRAMRRRS
jgi:hypothetical protein